MSEVPVLYSNLDEQCYLGCVISSNGEAFDSFPLELEAISHYLHREIFAVILGLHSEKGKINRDTICSKIGPDRCFKIGYPDIEAICYYPAPSLVSQFHKNLSDLLSLRKARMLAQKMLAEINPQSDAGALCQQYASEAAALAPNSVCENQRDVACAELDKRLDMLLTGNKEQGFQTPLAAWNRAFGGICPGNLYALAARPGAGKTALMEQIVGAYLMDERPVLVFEKDMSPRMLIERIACRFAKVPYWKLARGLVDRYDVDEIRRFNEALKKSPLLLYNPTGLTAQKMSSITRREKRVSGIEAVMLDHVGVLTVGKDLREGLTQASICIRTTTNETDIPHIILAHINRNGSKGRPTPEDIKEFDQLYGDCDGMGILWTDQDKTALKSGELLAMKIYFAKNRNGPVVEESVLFDGSLMAFRNPVLETK